MDNVKSELSKFIKYLGDSPLEYEKYDLKTLKKEILLAAGNIERHNYNKFIAQEQIVKTQEQTHKEFYYELNVKPQYMNYLNKDTIVGKNIKINNYNEFNNVKFLFRNPRKYNPNSLYVLSKVYKKNRTVNVYHDFIIGDDYNLYGINQDYNLQPYTVAGYYQKWKPIPNA